MPVQEVRDLGGEVVLRHLGHGKERREAGPRGARRRHEQPRVLTGCAPARRLRGPVHAVAPPPGRRRRGGACACAAGSWLCEVVGAGGRFRGGWRRDADGASAGSDGGVCCVGVQGIAGLSLGLASLALLEAAVGAGRVCGAVGPGPCGGEAGPCLRPQPCLYLVWVKALV